MKRSILILFIIFPLTLVSQARPENGFPNIYSIDIVKLKALLDSKQSFVKVSDKEFELITKLINDNRDKHFEIIDKIIKSVPLDENGKPVGKADPKLRAELNEQNTELYNSVNKILGERRCRQFNRTLIYEAERMNSERLNNKSKTSNNK